jgi:hypothetical protein
MAIKTLFFQQVYYFTGLYRILFWQKNTNHYRYSGKWSGLRIKAVAYAEKVAKEGMTSRVLKGTLLQSERQSASRQESQFMPLGRLGDWSFLFPLVSLRSDRVEHAFKMG